MMLAVGKKDPWSSIVAAMSYEVHCVCVEGSRSGGWTLWGMMPPLVLTDGVNCEECANVPTRKCSLRLKRAAPTTSLQPGAMKTEVSAVPQTVCSEGLGMPRRTWRSACSQNDVRPLSIRTKLNKGYALARPCSQNSRGAPRSVTGPQKEGFRGPSAQDIQAPRPQHTRRAPKQQTRGTARVRSAHGPPWALWCAAVPRGRVGGYLRRWAMERGQSGVGG